MRQSHYPKASHSPVREAAMQTNHYTEKINKHTKVQELCFGSLRQASLIYCEEGICWGDGTEGVR